MPGNSQQEAWTWEDWLSQIIDLTKVRADNRIMVTRNLNGDNRTIADRKHHDTESVYYDEYLLEEPVLSTENWLVPVIVQMLGTGTVVDLGCGTGRVAQHLIDTGRQVIAVDHSLGMLHKTVDKTNSDFLVPLMADTRELPLRSHSCDAVLCSGVLHHLPDWERVLQEAARILRPGGRMVIREPNASYAEQVFTPIESILAAPGNLRRLREGHQSSGGAESVASQQSTVASTYERHLTAEELSSKMPSELKTHFVTSTMLLGSLGLESWIPGRRYYYRKANSIDKWLFDHRFSIKGGALLVALLVKEV